MLYHYTSIQTLALILESRKIRFNRLDRVDDVRESQTVAGINFGQYFFVSCWTRTPGEQIPLWKMYTPDMRGVLIGLSDQPFLVKEVSPPPYWNLVKEGNPIFDILTLEESFGPDYLIIPGNLDAALNPTPMFGGPVTYVRDVEEIYRSSINVSRSETNFDLKVSNLPVLVRTKSQDWCFQDEYRFALQAYPAIPVPPEGPGAHGFAERLANHTANCLAASIAPGIEYIDVQLSPSALADLSITLGPMCTRGDRILVESLLAKFSPTASLCNSALTGSIRVPRR